MTIVNGKHFNTDNKIISRSRMHGYGIVVKEYKGAAPKLSQCIGCRDDYYNQKGNSINDRCLSFSDARVVDKVGYSTLNVCGGVDTIMKGTLSCWHAVSR